MKRSEYIDLFSNNGFIGDDGIKKRLYRDLAAEVWDYAKHEKQLTITADKTLDEDDSGLAVNIGTDALTLTLPKITADNLGMWFLVRNIGADGNNIITISPNAVDGINGTVPNAAADSVASGVVNKNFVNTKATANNGDWVLVKAVALTKWYITGGVGIWASEG